jgi:lysophospholipase L1-like esterase
VVAQPVLWRADLPDADRALLWFPIRTPNGEVRPSPAWLAREMQRFNDAQRAIAARHGARYVDPRLPATRDNFFDDCHFTDAGNRALADALYPAAAALLDQAAARIP